MPHEHTRRSFLERLLKEFQSLPLAMRIRPKEIYPQDAYDQEVLSRSKKLLLPSSLTLPARDSSRTTLALESAHSGNKPICVTQA